jgi:hypothetical protein
VSAGEDLLAQPVGSGESHQPFHAAQSRLLVAAFRDGHTMTLDASQDGVERLVVVQVPAERRDVLGGAAPQQEVALVVVEAKPHHVRRPVVEVHADGVAAESSPVAELLGLDHDVAQMDLAEHRRAHRLLTASAESGLRKSMTN